jgi:hypothetical protein
VKKTDPPTAGRPSQPKVGEFFPTCLSLYSDVPKSSGKYGHITVK